MLSCLWFNHRVTENLEELQRFIPRSYPREIQEKGESKLNKAALGVGCVAVLASLLSVLMTYLQKQKRVFQFAQVEFVFLVLLGLVMVAIAAILAATPPTHASCVAVAWLINVGYTLELVPLVVKIAAINRLMQAAMRMKRIKLSRDLLLGIVAAVVGLVGIYSTIWTILDPPTKTGSYSLTDEWKHCRRSDLLLRISISVVDDHFRGNPDAASLVCQYTCILDTQDSRRCE